MKKILVLTLAVSFLLILSACGSKITVTFILDGETHETRTLDEPSILYGLPNPSENDRFFTGWYTDETFEDPFDIMTMIETDTTLYGYTIEVAQGEDNLYFTNSLSVPDYEGKSFLEDGIGVVELHACRDGDTADFIENDTIFRSRFLAIDTPESGHIYEPWGLPASDYACERMRNAETIVLEFDGDGNRSGNYGRYLAFVWVDGVLLNLELIEMGFTPAQGAGQFKYAHELQMAHNKADFTNLRLHADGESDPDYPYGAAAVDVTIQSLLEDPENYYLKPVNVEGIVTARIAQHVFIQDETTGHGIFFFAHYNPYDQHRLAIGNKVRIENAQFYADSKPFQSFFLTNYANTTRTVLETGVDFTVHSLPFSEITPEKTGLVGDYENLTITGFHDYDQIFYAENEQGDERVIFQMGVPYMQDGLVPVTWRIDFDTLEIGMTISFRAVTSERRNEGFVLLLTGPDNFTIHD